MLSCPICGQAFETGRTSWLLRCPGCGFERSTLAANIADAVARGVIKTGARADLALFATKDPAHLPYHAGVEHAQLVVQAGAIVHDGRAQAFSCG